MPVKIISFAIDDLPGEILSGIGEIIARWGYLEFQLGVIVREIAELPKDTGRVLTIGPGLSSLCGMLRTFASSDNWIADESLRSKINKLVKDVQDKVPHRNNYAHGVFGFKKEGDEKVFVRHLMRGPSHSVAPDVEVVTQGNLKDLAQEAQDLWERAQEITTKLKVAKKTGSH